MAGDHARSVGPGRRLQGIWAGERLLDAQWVHSHGGGNGSRVECDPQTFLSLGMVTTQGLPSLQSFARQVTGPLRAGG